MADTKQRKTVQPPNGGWGWMVVLGAALAGGFTLSLLSIYGLVYGEKLTQMGQKTVGVALVGNVMLLVMSFSGLISGPALKVYSPRRITIIGSVLSASGMILSGYATNIWHLIGSYSVLTGLGLGFLQSSTFIAVDSYFTTLRGRAVGICMSGTGLAQVLMPHLVQYLLDNYDYKRTTLVLGILALNGILGALLFHPVERHSVKENSKLSEDNVVIEVETSLVDDVSSEPLKLVDTKESEERVIKDDGLKPNCIERVKRLFDLDLLLDLTFINIIIGCCLGFTSNQHFNMLFPFFLQQEVGMDRNQTAICMSVLSATDIIGRLTIPVITEKWNISSRGIYNIGCITLALSRTMLSLQDEYMDLILASTVTGIFKSSIVINQNIVISDHFEKGDPKLSTALGINMVTRGITVITVGQLLGWVRDYYASYVVCFFAQNFLLIAISVLWSLEIMFKCHK